MVSALRANMIYVAHIKQELLFATRFVSSTRIYSPHVHPRLTVWHDASQLALGMVFQCVSGLSVTIGQPFPPGDPDYARDNNARELVAALFAQLLASGVPVKFITDSTVVRGICCARYTPSKPLYDILRTLAPPLVSTISVPDWCRTTEMLADSASRSTVPFFVVQQQPT